MINPEQAVKPSVLSQKPYEYNHIDVRVKLNQNESPFDIPDELKNEILEKFREKSWNRYPDKIGKPVRDAIAEYLSISPDRVIVGVGSDEILSDIAAVALNSSKKTMVIEPTFSMYRHCAAIFESELVTLTANPDLSYPVGIIIDKISDPEIGITFIATPNNPTGAALSIDEAADIADSAAGLVVFDEAYFEFSPVDLLPLQEEFSNVIITRTFSKALSLAGLRLGYMAADPQLNDFIYRIKKPFSVNQFTETAAITLLENRSLIENNIMQVKSGCAWLKKQINSIIGFETKTENTNFLLVESAVSGSEMVDKLAERGIAARDMSRFPMLKNIFRVNTGTEQENYLLINALLDIVKTEI